MTRKHRQTPLIMLMLIVVSCTRSSEPIPSTTAQSPQTTATTAQATTTTAPTALEPTLSRLAPPAFDALEWKRALSAADIPGIDQPEPVAEVGAKWPFTYTDGFTSVEVPAEMVYANEVVTMWFADDVPYDLDQVVLAADLFAISVMPIVTELIGSVPSPDVDDDPRVVVLHLNQLVGAFGEFGSYDLLPRAAFPGSNQREMVYIAGDLEPGSDLHLGTMTHGITHLIDYATRPNRPLWLAEGLALAEHVVGFDTVSSHLQYLAKEPVQLNGWGPLQADDRHYGAGFLAMVYLWEQHGPEAIRTVIESPYEGMAALGEALASQDVDLADFFSSFMVAIGTDHDPTSDTAIEGLRLPRRCGADRASALPWEMAYTIPQFTPRYVSLTGSGRVEVRFDGSSTIGPINDVAASGEWMWWAGPSDGSAATLTRQVDLSSLSSATLRFAMWFDTGYTDATVVMVSTDDGKQWTVVDGSDSRAVEIGDEPAGSGYTGWSGSGKAPTWVTESVDLSEYAGQSILLRFQYTTDLYEARVGFALDDIELVELEETDGAEDESSPWIGLGFQRVPDTVPQPWIVQLVDGPDSQPVEIVDGKGSLSVELGGSGSTTIGVAAIAPGTGARASFTLTLTGDATLLDVPGTGDPDTFDVPCSGWELESTAEYDLDQTNGHLRLTLHEPDGFTWSAREGIHDVVTIAADMTFGEEVDGAGGLMCRLSNAGFYEVNIADDGTFIVGVAIGLDYELLVEWTESAAINSGPGAVNRIRFECGDGYMAAYMNGVELARIEDDRLGPGRVAVVGASYLSDDYRVWYDNVLIEPGLREYVRATYDTFDGPSRQWGTNADRGSRTRVQESEYALSVSAKDWSAEAYSVDEFTDVTFSADFSLASIAPDALIGATCHTTSRFDQYLFLLAFDGSFTVQAAVDGEFMDIVPWSDGSGLLIEPDSVNHMRITCAEDRLVWVLNGSTLADELNVTITGGRIGFIAYTYEYGQLEMHVDNVLIIDQSSGSD